MARAKSKKKRGRPRQEHAKRRATTREGRKTGHDRADPGPPELRAKKLALLGRADLPLDPLGLLLGRELVDQRQYNAGRDVGDLLEIVGRATGASPVHGMWIKILAGGGIDGGQAIGDVSGAWHALDRLRRLLGNRIAALVFDVAGGTWPLWLVRLMTGRPRSHLRAVKTLADLRDGLDRVAKSWTGARRERAA